MKKLCVLALAMVLGACGEAKPAYDMTISGGRVIDPETNLDAVMHVGVIDGKITTLSDKPLAHSHQNIDATGKIVAPGFIDIHTHSPTPLGMKYQLLDGVTTQIDLEAGAFPVSEYGFAIADKPLLNYGSSVSHLAIRHKVIDGTDPSYLFTKNGPMKPGAAFVQPATPKQIEEIRTLLNRGLDQGGLGIGVLLDYISAAVTDAELRMIFEVAGKRNVPIAVHVRRGLPGDPAGLEEVLALAIDTGAPLMVSHITHSAMHKLPEWLAKIDAANTQGARVTTETLSFPAGGTSIGAAVFGRDWQSIFNITYSDVQWTATGEWLTKESFTRYRAQDPSGMVNHHYVKEDWMETAMVWPRMMVTTDVTPAFTEDVLANPNLAGTFARFLGHYVRDRNLMSLRDGLAKTSLYQAQWLETIAPAFKRKGRIQEGMDADIVIFDADIIKPMADYGDPYKASRGIDYVIVGGKVAAKKGIVVEQAGAGKRLSTSLQ